MERKMVIPGELVGAGDVRLGVGVYRDGEDIYSSTVGLLDEKKGNIRVIPITGKYFPRVDDFVIGMIKGAQFTNWGVDINSAYSGILNAADFFRKVDPRETDLNTILTPGTMVYAKVREITYSRKVFITMQESVARVLKGGRLVEMTPAKVPRVIGRKSSMLNTIRNESGCRIRVGQNGRIWIDGEPALRDIVERALKKIEGEAHRSGLTESIKELITKEREEYESRKTQEIDR
ncbi:MAG: exosome complex RNA-binding protein Rrp4 [Candidatus Hydrothermarchaeaceae archaeon]